MVSQTIFILLYRNNCSNLAMHLSKYVALLHWRELLMFLKLIKDSSDLLDQRQYHKYSG